MEIPSLTAVAALEDLKSPATDALLGSATLKNLEAVATPVAITFPVSGPSTSNIASASAMASRFVPVPVEVPIATRPHGLPLRGLFAPAANLNDGLFGQMFHLPAAKFGATDADGMANLSKLGAAMSGPGDPPKDGPDAEESGIPAAYTYFGQFIDHDLTFDPSSSLQKQIDPNAWWTSARRASTWTTSMAGDRKTSPTCINPMECTFSLEHP